jgi:hypothetical protein
VPMAGPTWSRHLLHRRRHELGAFTAQKQISSSSDI